MGSAFILTSQIQNESGKLRLLLAQGQVHRLRLARSAPFEIYCNKGSVWVTVQNDPEDVVLGGGNGVSLAGNSDVLVESLDPLSEIFVCKSLP